MKKKLLSLLLVTAMLLAAACGNKTQEGNKDPQLSQGEKEPSGDDKTDDGPAYVTEPVTIQFWHTMGSGALAEYMNDAVARFNKENEYGITVVATFMGSYADVRTQTITSIGAKDNPQVFINGMSTIMAETGTLLDMKPYAERDGFDLTGFLDGVQGSMYYEDQLTSLPVQRSCPVLYYNVDMFKAAGYDEIPGTYEEFLVAAKKVAQVNNVYGFEQMIDVNFYQNALIRSLGADGLCNADDSGAGCLEDGSMLRLLTDWRKGVDEGWILAPGVSSSHDSMYQGLYNKTLASFFASSAVLKTISTYAEQSGINLGVAKMPVYGGTGGVGGGGDISILAANNDEQQRAASWEFVKFMMSDEEIAKRSMASGYLPVTEKSAEMMSSFFEENPFFKTAYEERLTCEDALSNVVRNEWSTQVVTALSYVIQDRSMSPQEGVDYLKSMEASVFYE